MSAPADLDEAFQRARELQAQGRMPEAEQVLKPFATPGAHR